MPLDDAARMADLLERRVELGLIDRAIADALGGDGRVLAFEGPAGIGKTQLLEIARRDAAAGGVRVLTARAGELERDFAYGVVRQLLERAVAGTGGPERAALLDGPAVHAGLALGLAALAPGERPADDPAFAVRHGLYWLVANLAAQGPLLLAVDDAQWADAPSLRFLAYLARRLDGLGVLVVITVRSGDPGADETLLAELLGGPEVERVGPRPLSVQATGELVASDAGTTGVEDAFVQACHRATGGNPFLLRELRAALLADGVLPVAANVHRVEGLGPRTVARSLLLRLTRISAAAVALARAVAVVGSAVDPHHAGTVAGLDERAADDAFDGLSRAGILAPDRPLRFTHPILRDAVYRDLSPSVRDALHARAASSLRDHGASASEIAAHLLATPAGADPQAVPLLRRAATLALGQGAADVAARYLRRALDEPSAGDARPSLLAELGRATWLAGDDPLGALDQLRAALAAGPPEEERTALTIALARATFSTGDAAGAVAVVETELRRPGGRSRQDTLTLEAELGSIRLLYDITPELGAHVMSFADLPGETTAELLVLANVAAWQWTAGTAADTAMYAERSLGGGRAVQAAGSDSIAILQAAWVLSYAEAPALAQRTIDATVQDARRTGSVFGLTSSATMNALLAYRNGDLARAEAEARKGMAVPGLPPFAHPTLHTFLALPLVERGELDEADDVVARSWVGPHLPVLTQMNPAFWALGRLRLAQGRHEEAREALLEGLDRDLRLNIRNPGVPWRLDAALASTALGDHGEAVRLVAEHEPDARRWGTRGALGVWLHARGLLERDGATAEATLLDAIATLERTPARLDHARAVVDLGARLRRQGERVRARSALEAGLDLARGCGATALVRRAHEELLVAGARPRRLQFSGVESLTASERRVCELAAAGSTNREIAQELFVTPKTVENQLGRSYAKLAIRSREELAGALGAVPQGPPRPPMPGS